MNSNGSDNMCLALDVHICLESLAKARSPNLLLEIQILISALNTKKKKKKKQQKNFNPYRNCNRQHSDTF